LPVAPRRSPSSDRRRSVEGDGSACRSRSRDGRLLLPCSRGRAGEREPDEQHPDVGSREPRQRLACQRIEEHYGQEAERDPSLGGAGRREPPAQQDEATEEGEEDREPEKADV